MMTLSFIAMLHTLTEERGTMSDTDMEAYEHQLTADRGGLLYCRQYFRNALSYLFAIYRDSMHLLQHRVSNQEILTRVTTGALEDKRLIHMLFCALRLQGERANSRLTEGLQYVDFRKYMHRHVDTFIKYLCNTMNRVQLELWNDRRTAGHGTVRCPLEVGSTS